MKPIIHRLLSLAVPGVMSVTVAAQSVMTQSISFKVKDVTDEEELITAAEYEVHCQSESNG